MTHRNKSIGSFITFEGIDGCGKTTQRDLLQAAMKQSGIPFLCTREPGGSALGREIRKTLLDPDYIDPPTARAELLLFLADRAQHVEKTVRPALLDGITVISDRYTDSTLIYQGCARGLDRQELRTLNQMATGGLIPDRTILFDLSPEVSARRALDASGEFKKADRLEQENDSFRKKIRQGFLELAQEEPDRIVLLDAGQSRDRIHAAVIAALTTLPGLESLHV